MFTDELVADGVVTRRRAGERVCAGSLCGSAHGAGDSPISRAISLICLPVGQQPHHAVLAVRELLVQRLLRIARAFGRRISASEALTYLPPLATLRTAVVSSCGALSS